MRGPIPCNPQASVVAADLKAINVPPPFVDIIIKVMKQERFQLETQSVVTRTRFPRLDNLQVIRRITLAMTGGTAYGCSWKLTPPSPLPVACGRGDLEQLAVACVSAEYIISDVAQRRVDQNI
jgi:hypothetical protein|mmetsp:Transcript_68111/g.188744  ORF Transcript_68111/g.188744 Transcript_68111/m.188744 type:complete len:123 (-) Transcript_68111:2450-2818(-)